VVLVCDIGALLSMAAHMNGRAAAVLDQVGMAQKEGPSPAHIHIADDPITALRIPNGRANLVLACDQIVGNARDVMAAISPGRTYVVANADVSITGEFTQDRDGRLRIPICSRDACRNAPVRIALSRTPLPGWRAPVLVTRSAPI